MSSKQFKAALVGLGVISYNHLSALSTLDNVKVVALCDIKRERAEERKKEFSLSDAKIYESYDEMLECEDLDTVHIMTPHYLHAEMAIKALEKNVNVCLEKPICINCEQISALLEAEKKSSAKITVCFQNRFAPAFMMAKKLADEDGVVSAYFANFWERTAEYYTESGWRGSYLTEGGGALINQAIHSIDLVHWMINSEVESVSCSMANRGHSIVKVEDSAEGLITYKNGVRYGFYCMNNYGCDEPIEIKLFCENGKVVFGYDDAYIYYNDGTIEEAHQDENIDKGMGGKDYWGFQHIRQIEQFYKAVRGEEPLEISGEEALKTHKLVMKLYEEGKMRP